MNRYQVIRAVTLLAVLVWSDAVPHDYPTWVLEVAPAIIGAAVLWLTRESFPLTPIACVLILIKDRKFYRVVEPGE